MCKCGHAIEEHSSSYELVPAVTGGVLVKRVLYYSCCKQPGCKCPMFTREGTE